MTREGFHDALERIELELLTMGELTSTAVQQAVLALVERDEALAQSVIDGDDPIDELYLNIDHSVLELLALQSPVAADLRLVTKTEPGSATMRQQIAEMGGIVVDMVRTAMESFARRDLALCMKLPFMDDPVDRLNRATHLEALKLADDPRSLDWGLHMNMAARALERVGDNAVDIGEQVGFLITGEFREFTDASHPVDA
jgi:phosphate transport system protein